jgi:hypothetical protein
LSNCLCQIDHYNPNDNIISAHTRELSSYNKTVKNEYWNPKNHYSGNTSPYSIMFNDNQSGHKNILLIMFQAFKHSCKSKFVFRFCSDVLFFIIFTQISIVVFRGDLPLFFINIFFIFFFRIFGGFGPLLDAVRARVDVRVGPPDRGLHVRKALCNQVGAS